jgi:hypothetical protein
MVHCHVVGQFTPGSRSEVNDGLNGCIIANSRRENLGCSYRLVWTLRMNLSAVKGINVPNCESSGCSVTDHVGFSIDDHTSFL